MFASSKARSSRGSEKEPSEGGSWVCASGTKAEECSWRQAWGRRRAGTTKWKGMCRGQSGLRR